MDIIIKEYSRVIWQKKWPFLLILVALTLTTFLELYNTHFYKNIANALTEPYSEATLAILMENLSYIALFFVITWFAWRALEIGIIPVDGGGVALLEKRCFEVLLKQNYTFFEDSFSGSLIKQSYRFAHAYESIMDWFFFHFFQNVLAIVISFFIFYQQQPLFAFYFLLWVVLFVTWTIAFSIWKLRFDKDVQEWNSKLGGKFSDAISNIFIVKSFAMESPEQSIVNENVDIVYKKKIIAWALMFVSFAVQGIMTFAIEYLLIYLMIQKWKQGNFDVGEFVLFQSIMLILVRRLWEFGRNFRHFFGAIADASEMADVFRNTDFEKDSKNASDKSITQGAIKFRHVNFKYHKDNSLQLFDDFNLNIKAGEKIALVGQSGSGKTSLTKLLFRFFDPQQGSVEFDGINAKDFTLKSLRQQISLVPQQPELFHRTIKDNICLGEELSDEALREVARKARSLEFIEQLPKQFETLVGERGVKLSGGEKQRIAIARAFLQDAPIVVLDEATSALDSLTEKQIQVAIFELIKDKTAIVIAHRLSTILRMDRIIVLGKGKIIEQGTHQELLDLKGNYYAMWQHQSGEFIAD
ncbi:MAG TPA: ABC transporter ATP-binding protein [Leucothrix mucor]|nr:ABC transporter ATP-binding protein [Leucothrix mucor]